MISIDLCVKPPGESSSKHTLVFSRHFLQIASPLEEETLIEERRHRLLSTSDHKLIASDGFKGLQCSPVGRGSSSCLASILSKQSPKKLCLSHQLEQRKKTSHLRGVSSHCL